MRWPLLTYLGGFCLLLLMVSHAWAGGPRRAGAYAYVGYDCCIIKAVGMQTEEVEYVTKFANEEAARIRRMLGLDPRGTPVHITVTRNLRDFNVHQPEIDPGAPRPHFKGWVAGVAYPKEREIVIRLSAGPPPRIRNTLTHELAHIYVGEASHYAPLPRWFEEGVAMLLAHNETARHLKTVVLSASTRSLPRLSDLTRSFPNRQPLVERAYATSFAFLHWVIGYHGGFGSIRELLALVRSGEDFYIAIERTFDHSLPNLEQRWRGGFVQSRWVTFLVSFEMIMWFLVGILFVVAWWLVRKRHRLAVEKMGREEALLGLDDDYEPIERVEPAIPETIWSEKIREDVPPDPSEYH